jgi:Protein of unknown function (DUF3551)
MKSTSKKIAASGAALFAFALMMTTAPVARADDFCITNGAQAAHGCGYPTMEACRMTANGIGGTCSPAHSSTKNPNDAVAQSRKNPNDALAQQPRTRRPAAVH